MDSPDMDDLLDSLEDPPTSTSKIEPSQSFKSTLSSSKKDIIDDSAAIKPRQTLSSLSHDDGNNKSLNNSSTKNGGDLKVVKNDMNGMDEVLNELDMEDNKHASNLVQEEDEGVELIKDDGNESNIAENVNISNVTEAAESSAFVETEFSRTKEDAEVAAILNSMMEKTILEFPKVIKVVNGYPENIERILNNLNPEEKSEAELESNIEGEMEKSADANISIPNVENTMKEETVDKEVALINSEEVSEHVERIFKDESSTHFKVEETVSALTETNDSEVQESLSEVVSEKATDISTPNSLNTVKENFFTEEVTLTHSKEASDEVERIFKDDTVEIESLNFILPVVLPPPEDESVESNIEPEMQDIIEKMEECIQTMQKDELVVEETNSEEKMHSEDLKDNLNVQKDTNQVEVSKPEGDHANASSDVTVEFENAADIEQQPQSEPVEFDTSEEINEKLNDELLQELDQMAEDQVKEGTIEAAAVVAAESKNAEPEPEPARSYILDTPLIRPNTVILSTHDLSVVNSNPPLTESELQLGKVKPYWIPDEDCSHCMLCSSRFTVINRRHHCRCCGRVLCSSCCNIKKALPYIEDPEKKQRVCEPCSKTLDKIDDYEYLQAQIQQRQSQRRHQISECEGPENEAVENIPEAATNSGTVLRKKSVLKSKNSERSETEQKRTVKFLDGIRPGHDNMIDQPGPSGVAAASASSASSSTALGGTVSEASNAAEEKPSKKKVPKGVHRRNRERRVQEEQISLVREDHLFVVDCDAQMTKLSMDKILKKLVDGEKITVAIKRNLWVVIQLVTYRNSKVWFFSSQGMATIGADELCLAFEAQDFDFEIINEVIQFYMDERKRAEENKTDSMENSEVLTENLSPPRSLFITSVLYLFDHFFLDSLIPSNESLDEKVGIRKVGERISAFYRVPQGEINGIEAAAVIFHRPIGQNFENLPIPTFSPFLIGTFIQKSELIWAMTIPNRLLLKIGLQASHFPFPIVNERNRASAYLDSSENTVLKVFNDFKNWSYRLPKILGSTVEIENGITINVRIPKWTIEEIKQILESNRNMLAWASTLTDHADCHLVAIQNAESTFRTEIFTDVESTREKIGCNFIVLDGSLKNCSDNFQMSIVEDGVIVRVSSETMEEISKCLLVGASFSTKSQNMSLNLIFAEPFEPKYKIGGLFSPIDQLYLIGKYQYGLNLSRQFRSQMLIPSAPEWALRLSTVINIEDGKIPIQLQPRYFEICEQVGVYMAGTIGSFVKALTISDQRQICIRIKLESDMVTYDTAKWQGLEQEHYVWTAALDDQLIPYLYQLCPLIQSTFHMELHFSLISIRLLSNVEY